MYCVIMEEAFSHTQIIFSDIGATNVRFACYDVKSDVFSSEQAFQCSDFPDFIAALGCYYHMTDSAATEAVIAVACPVQGDSVELTNLDWEVSKKTLCQELGLKKITFINDVQALGYAIPKLRSGEFEAIGAVKLPKTEGAPFGLVAPGSGLGCTGLLHTNHGTVAIPSEGGHMTLAPRNTLEENLIETMSHEYGHVSAERLVSGMGLKNIYGALCQLSGHTPQAETASQITQLALTDECFIARQTFEVFSGFLGGFCGNVTLMLGARSGLYLGGGILRKIGSLFDSDLFRTAFEDKGRFQDYLTQVPTFLITHPFPTFLGIAAYLSSPLALESP